jgi:hypothetical protein
MPLRKKEDIEQNALEAIQEALAQPSPLLPESYQYEAELKMEVVKRIQVEADKILSQEEWVVIDGVDKR